MISLTTGSLGEHTITGLLIALVFAYIVNVHREHDKRLEELEKEFTRRDEEKCQDPGDRT